jgi:hypothetical protein
MTNNSTRIRLLYAWSVLAPSALFITFVQILYMISDYPVNSVGSVVSPWISIGIFFFCLLIGFFPMMKLARSGTFGRGVLALYVMAMLFIMTYSGLWIACRHGDCF